MSEELHFEENSNANNIPQEEIKTEDSENKVGETVNSQPEVKPTPTTNALQTEEYSSQSLSSTNYRVSLPSINLLTFSNKLKQFNNADVDKNSKEIKNWKEVAEGSVDYYTVGSLYQSRFTEDNSEFKQGIETKEGTLNSISSLKFKKTDGELKGEVALLKVSKMLGLGDVISVPLPHSGIWVTIKPPTEKDLIDFYNSIFREKIMLGRATYGLTLTNFSVHINHRLFDFILKHIHSVNYSDINKDQLRNYILIHDFPILAWGFACTMFPNGYEYSRACVNDLEKCSHVVKAVLNLTKLLWVDNPSLTEAQKLILAENRPNKLTTDSYRKFISEHSRVVSSSFTCKNGVKFKLRVPTFNEYTVDGLAWINKINSSIENLILEVDDVDEDGKTELLNQYVKSSILRQFNHFVDFIELEDNVITDRDTINSVLEVFSADDDIRSEITENILKFKVDTTLGLIGIPAYKCPNCGEPQNKDTTDSRFVEVIPLDVMNLSFLFLTSKISRILEREV